MSSQDAASVLVRAYRRLARAFPQEFSQVYGDDVTGLSEEMIADASKAGWAGFILLIPRIFWDLLWRITAEYWNELKQDTSYSLRAIRKAPGFATLSILSLGFGIGMCTSTYSQFEGTMFRKVPGVADASTLVTKQGGVSYPVYEHFRDHSGQFQSIAAYLAPVPFVLQTTSGPQRTWGHLVTTNYFEVLRPKIFAGRALGPQDREGSTATAVISYRLWQNRFGGDRSVVGSTLQINGQPVQVVGITGDEFLGASPVAMVSDIWLPMTVQQRIAPELANGLLQNRKLSDFHIIGRLSPGIATKQAEAALDSQVRQLEQANNDPGKDRGGRRVKLAGGGRVLPIRDEDLPLLLTFPIALIAIMLWIVCANVATMLLARSIARRREIAVRLAVGASRWRMVRQLLTESTILALAGGLAGLPIAYASNRSMDAFTPMMPTYTALAAELSIPALLFTFVVSAFTGIIFGLTPALQSTKADLSTALKAGSVQKLSGYRWFSSRNMLILQQVAGSVTLLLLTGFVILGFEQKANVEIGYEPKDLWTISMDPQRDGYNAERTLELLKDLRQKVERIPGVISATINTHSPLSQFGQMEETSIEQPIGNPEKRASVIRVEPLGAGFFQTVGVKVLRGRVFEDVDYKTDAPRVTVINETLANASFPNQDAIGKTIDLRGHKYEVIGVTRNVRTGWVVDRSLSGAYVPIEPKEYLHATQEGLQLLVRTQPGVDAGAEVRKLAATIDPKLSVFNISPMTEQVKNFMQVVKVSSAIYASIGLYGLILAAIGLAGVTAYAVLQRTKEIGIRVALGARRGDVLRLVLREGVALTIAGSAIGIACAIGVHKAASAFLSLLADLTKTSISDPLLVIGCPALLLGFTLLACYGPARRALRVDPLNALRDE
jgi:predicted permease